MPGHVTIRSTAARRCSSATPTGGPPIRDDIAPPRASDWFGQVNPVQQQLLGGIEGGNGDHAWGHCPEHTPLYAWLNERGFLDPANPPLKP